MNLEAQKNAEKSKSQLKVENLENSNSEVLKKLESI